MDNQTKLHVLYVTSVFGYPPLGGPCLRTYNTVKAISRIADVSLYLLAMPEGIGGQRGREHLLSFCRSVYWPRPDETPNPIKQALKDSRLMPPFLLRILARGSRLVRRWLGVWRCQVAQLRSLAEWVRANNVDVIWIGYGNILYHLVWLKAMTGRKIVIDTDSVWSRYVLRELPYETDPVKRRQIQIAGWRKRWEELWGTNYADITTAVSEEDQAYYRRLTPFKERIMLLSNVVDVESYAKLDASVQIKRPALCLSGSMGTSANTDAGRWLIRDVMPMVWSRYPELHVYIVGRNPSPEVLALADDRVTVTGSVPSILPYLQQAEAAVVPLRFESGTRFKILEAFACRTPVVSTTLGAEGLNVADGQHLLLADTPVQFAEAIGRVLSDGGLRERLISAGYMLVNQEYGLPAAERQVQAILQALGF